MKLIGVLFFTCLLIGQEIWPFEFELLSKIDGKLHSSPVFSTDKSEAYFEVLKRENGGYKKIIYRIRRESGGWKRPESAAFSGKYNDSAPRFSIDGKRLYFASNRPLNDLSNVKSDTDIWYIERKEMVQAYLVCRRHQQ